MIASPLYQRFSLQPGHDYQLQLWSSQYHPSSTLVLLDGGWIRNAISEFLAAHPKPSFTIASLHYLGSEQQVAQQRAYDFTPLGPNGSTQDPRMPYWQCGGAQRFLHFIENTVQPFIAQHTFGSNTAPIALFGHSYAGLFGLYATLHSNTFQHIFAASPSLWWYWPQVLDLLTPVTTLQPKKLDIWVGEQEQWHPKPIENGFSRGPGVPTLPLAQTFVKHLQQHVNWPISIDVIKAKNHGAMLHYAALRALNHMQVSTINS